jgi:hypothetical protein
MDETFDRKTASIFLGISIASIDRNRGNGKLSFYKFGKRVLFAKAHLTAIQDLCSVLATVTPASGEKLETAKTDGGGNALNP